VTARDRIILLVVAAAAVLAGFWFLALAPKRDDGKALDLKVAAAQQRLQTAQASASAAETAKARYQRDYATVARLGKAVPVDDDVPSLVYQLESASHRNAVDFRSIKLETSAVPAAAAAAPAPAPTGSSSTPASSAAAVSSASTAPAQLPPGAVVGAAGFPTMPFSFTFDGSFFKLESFVRTLDNLTALRGDDTIAVKGRLLTIDGIALTAGPKGFPQVSSAMAATAYLLPSDEGLTNGATADAPGAPAGATSPSTSAAESFRSDNR